LKIGGKSRDQHKQSIGCYGKFPVLKHQVHNRVTNYKKDQPENPGKKKNGENGGIEKVPDFLTVIHHIIIKTGKGACNAHTRNINQDSCNNGSQCYDPEI